MTRTMDQLSPADIVVGQVWLRSTTEPLRQKLYRVRKREFDTARMEAVDGSGSMHVKVSTLLAYWSLHEEANA